MTNRNERTDQSIEQFSAAVTDNLENQTENEQTVKTATDEKAEKKDTVKSETQQSCEDEDNSSVAESEKPIKERKGVLMYLPDKIWHELDIRFDEVNAKHKRKHDEALEKNRDYYPAVIQAGLTDDDLEDILDL